MENERKDIGVNPDLEDPIRQFFRDKFDHPELSKSHSKESKKSRSTKSLDSETKNKDLKMTKDEIENNEKARLEEVEYKEKLDSLK